MAKEQSAQQALRERAIYNHPRSQELRAPPAKRTEVDELRVKHLDATAAMVRKHREESRELQEKLNRERAKHPHIANGAKPPEEYYKQEIKQTVNLGRRHALARQHLAEQHGQEMVAAAKRLLKD